MLQEAPPSIEEIDVDAVPVDLEDPDIKDSRAPGKPLSELQRLCGEYLQDAGNNPTFIDKIARALFNDTKARGICRRRAMKNGVNFDDTDEVVQRVMEIFIMKMIYKLRDVDAVYPIIFAIAENVSKEVGREVLVAGPDHNSIEEMMENGHELQQVSLMETVEEDGDVETSKRLTIARMVEALGKRANGESVKMNTRFAGTLDALPMVNLVPATAAGQEEALAAEAQTATPAATQAPQGRRKGGSRAELSAEQAELVRIGEELELRNQDYAVLLGIGLPRLSSYIYGRTASVPEEVMERARQLLKEHRKSQGVRAAKFKKPMSEIVADWEKRLGTESNEELAAYLGVTTMTIHRWKANENTPDMTALVRYDAVVERWVKTIQQQAEKIKGGKAA